MDKQYPLVTEHALKPVPPKKFISRKYYGRTSEEVPVPLVGHRLVYLLRGDYVPDTGSLALDSPTVIEATQVSVVDVTTDTEVSVELTVPSRDGSYFTLRVTFLCTVEDPVAVLRTGGHDAKAIFAGYLRGHQRIFEVGLDFGLDAINDVRRKLSAQVRAYVTLSPPEFAGMVAELGSVEVSTPDEVAKFHGALREEQRTHVVKTEKLTNEHRLGDMEDSHKRRREVRDSEHAHELDGAQREHARQELRLTADAVASDPVAALSLAFGAGEINAKQFADELKQLREREVAQDREDLQSRIAYDRGQARLQWDAERADRAQRVEWDREDRQLEREASVRAIDAMRRERDDNRQFEHDQARANWEDERADRQLDREASTREIEATHRERDDNRQFEHDQARANWEAARADRAQQAEWAREDRRLVRENAVREVEGKLELVRELAKRGYTDMLNIRLDKFVNDMLGGQEAPTIATKNETDPPQITATEEPQPAEYVDDDDQNTKVEA
jgi:hypothetical protein